MTLQVIVAILMVAAYGFGMWCGFKYGQYRLHK